MTLLEECCQLIASFEGFRSAPYQNPGDRPTIGYGNTFYEDGTAVTLDDTAIDEDRAQVLLSYFVQKILDKITELVTVELNNDQTAALTSFEYNTGHLEGSTLLAKLNAGDIQGAGKEFYRWVHVGGVVNNGLMFRRTKEEQLFLSQES